MLLQNTPLTPKMEVGCSSKMLVSTYKNTWGHNPEDHNLNNGHHENLITYTQLNLYMH
jgi:hypothetical protein